MAGVGRAATQAYGPTRSSNFSARPPVVTADPSDLMADEVASGLAISMPDCLRQEMAKRARFQVRDLRHQVLKLTMRSEDEPDLEPTSTGFRSAE
jgi:hypothetical protein